MYYILVKSQNWRKDNLSKRDTTKDPLCKKFGENREAAHHFISECPAYATVRLDIFGFPYISLSNIITNFGPENWSNRFTKQGELRKTFSLANLL